jgi:hypothetical protein
LAFWIFSAKDRPCQTKNIKEIWGKIAGSMHSSLIQASGWGVPGEKNSEFDCHRLIMAVSARHKERGKLHIGSNNSKLILHKMLCCLAQTLQKTRGPSQRKLKKLDPKSVARLATVNDVLIYVCWQRILQKVSGHHIG